MWRGKKFEVPFQFDFIHLFFIGSLFAVGLLHEALACIATVILCVYLASCMKKNKCLELRWNLCSVSAVMISCCYLVVGLWAVDAGMAFLGFLKFLPLPLFLLAFWQQRETGEGLLDVLPPVMCAMTVISAVIMLFMPRNPYFAPSGRLSGFLQYSNTFALLLLMSVILLAVKEKLSKSDFLFLPILLFGIILSGSRTVFLLSAFSIVLLLFFSKNKGLRIFLLSSAAAVLAVGVLYAAVTGNFATIGRFLTTSLTESTFVGRMLYYSDALPVILKHPFGTGYFGHYYLQQSIQTGLYSVRFVHNDFLQLMLDVGWIPALFLLAAMLHAFFKKGAGVKKRMLLFVMAAHSMLDFDLQFVAVFFILLLLLEPEQGKRRTVKLPRAFFAVPAVISIYMAIPLATAIVNLNSFSHRLYPWNTDVNAALLTRLDDPAEMNRLADHILKQNNYVTVAYSAKAAYAFSRGDFANVIKYKDLAIKNAPFATEEYEDYIYMLLVGQELYRRAGDKNSMEFCKSKMDEVIFRFGGMERRLSRLGKRINDKPRMELSEEIRWYLEHPEQILAE